MTTCDHSFVVLAHGDSPFLEGALRSVTGQTTPGHVVIATSTPSAQIDGLAKAFGVEVTVNPRKDGIAADWNFGLRATGARYVTLAHQDDVYFPRFLERTLTLFAAHPAGALAFTGYQEVDDHGAAKSSKISKVKHLLQRLIVGERETVRGARLRAFLSFGNPLPCSSVTYDRQQLGEFEFCGDYASNLDWEAWSRLQARGETFLHASERLIGRRHNALTATSQLIRDGRRRREDLAMFRRLWPAPIGDAVAFLYRASY